MYWYLTQFPYLSLMPPAVSVESLTLRWGVPPWCLCNCLGRLIWAGRWQGFYRWDILSLPSSTPQYTVHRMSGSSLEMSPVKQRLTYYTICHKLYFMNFRSSTINANWKILIKVFSLKVMKCLNEHACII